MQLHKGLRMLFINLAHFAFALTLYSFCTISHERDQENIVVSLECFLIPILPYFSLICDSFEKQGKYSALLHYYLITKCMKKCIVYTNARAHWLSGAASRLGNKLGWV